jgi:tetratricopeptide (TPR) repeat protein
MMAPDVTACRHTLKRLMSCGPLSDSACQMLLAAYRDCPDPEVLARLVSAEPVKHNHFLRGALDRLMGQMQVGPPPKGRLHPILQSRSLNRIRIYPVVIKAGRNDLLVAVNGLLAFHRQEFGHPLEVQPILESALDMTVEALFEGTDSDELLCRSVGLRPGPSDVVVVGVGGQPGHGPMGFTTGRVAFFSLPRLVWCDALLAHEFYHAALDLEHADGEADVFDPASVMAVPSLLSQVSDTQKGACVTSGKAWRLGRSGEAAARARRFGDAIEWYQKALAADPAQRYAILGLAEAWVWEGHLDEVTRLLSNPYHWAVRALAGHLLAAGRVQEASQVMESLPSGQQACLWHDAGYFDQALEAYEKDASHGYAQDGMAASYIGQGRWREAELILLGRLRSSPESPTLHGMLAQVRAARGNRRGAMEAIRYAVAMPGRDSPFVGRMARSSVYRLLRDWQKAAGQLRHLVKAAPCPQGPWLDLAWCLWMAGAVDDALQAFQSAVLASPSMSLSSRLAQAWLDHLRSKSPTPLAHTMPYSIPALHLDVLLSGNPASQKRLSRLTGR